MDTLTDAERNLIDWVGLQTRVAAENAARHSAESASWRYKSVHELLLAHGRLFTPRTTPPDQLQEPQECYGNASNHADDNPDTVYVEGLAICPDPLGLDFEHAWCADGTDAWDPTWPDGQAYLGVPMLAGFRRRRQRESGFSSVLWNVGALELLRDGLPDNAVADAGRPLPVTAFEVARRAHRDR